MSFPSLNAVPMVSPPIQIEFPDDGGLTITIPEAPPVQVGLDNNLTVTIPSGEPTPPVCLNLNSDGDLVVTVPSGLIVSIPLEALEELRVNGVAIANPTRKPRCLLKFQSGGAITVLRRTAVGSKPGGKRHVKVDGLNTLMHALE